MTPFVTRWIITAAALALVAASHIIPGIWAADAYALIGASLLLGIVNAFVRPIVLLLSLPLILFTLGFFILIVNALMG